ncbi:HAD-IA family hydrolase [Litoribacillus peritrichatus]|uniref:HAD-IA family hydrolase n=1 Tax=Litoribacillus peritrichatus TaxID=718191 RepID=A0ABP7N3V4_9GAMM
MMENKYDLVIFDWDGTLVDSADLIVGCMQSAFQDASVNVPVGKAVRNIIGLGIKEAIRTLDETIDEDCVELVRQRYGHHFHLRDTGELNVFDGVYSLLDDLSGSRIRSAVATGKSRRGLKRGLAKFKAAHHFEVTRCADETQSKPHPLMLSQILAETSVPLEKAIMVGDSIYDMEMARNIGMDSVAVTYGVHSKDELSAFSPTEYVDNVDQLKLFLLD